MAAVRVYGGVVAAVAAGDRVARITADGAETVFDAVEEIGRAALVNRVVAGLPPDVGWVAVTASGISWPDGAAEALRAAAVPRAGLLGPRLLDRWGVLLPSSGPPFPTGQGPRALPSSALPSALASRSVRRLGSFRRRRVVPVPVGRGVTGWLDGRCVLLRRAAWDSVNGYDTRVGPCARALDVDLGTRLARAGWLVLGVPNVEVVVPQDGGHGMLSR